MDMSIVAKAAFAKLEHEYLRTQEWNDVDAFTIIGNFAAVHPPIAHALALHCADVLQGHAEDVDWTEIIIEVYRRTFFDKTAAAKYGTGDIAESDDRMKHFADYLVMQFVVHEAGSKNVVAFEPAHRM